MATVSTNASPKISVSIGSARVVTSATPQSSIATNATLGNLSGVDTSGVQNGYTLVYDATSGNFQAKPASDVAANVTAIDGGTF
tara:strand:+ start:3662 stop:3913 length:252 start_codon:yes stop_codon:yes gene_type:complete